MKLEKLTVKSQEALQAAQSPAIERGHPEITPEHLLFALLHQDGGLVPILLNRIGADVDLLRRRIRDMLGASPSASGGATPQVGDRLRLLLESAERRAADPTDERAPGEADLGRPRARWPRARWRGAGAPPSRCQFATASNSFMAAAMLCWYSRFASSVTALS